MNEFDIDKQLWLKVVLQAIRDCKDSDPEIRQDAEDFLSGKTGVLQEVCNMFELNATAIINEFKKNGGSGLYTLLVRAKTKMDVTHDI